MQKVNIYINMPDLREAEGDLRDIVVAKEFMISFANALFSRSSEDGTFEVILGTEAQVH